MRFLTTFQLIEVDYTNTFQCPHTNRSTKPNNTYIANLPRVFILVLWWTPTQIM